MNRTILIVICDFLLVSLLAFSTVDINKVGDQSASRLQMGASSPTVTNRVGGREDLGDVMRLALEEERKKQDALALELSQTRQTASQREALLNQRNEQLQTVQQQLRSQMNEATQLEERQTNLLQQMTAAQSNIATLNRQLQAESVENVLTKEERAAQEAKAKKEMEQAAALRQQLAALERSNQLVVAEREQLAGQLQSTESEKLAATARLAQAQEDLSAQRQENSKLAENVKSLSTNSSQLAQEIRENRALSPNEIFNQFIANRLQLNLQGVRPGFFGGKASKDKQTETILATDGTNTYALCHVQDTLFTLWEPGTDWKQLTGTIAHGQAVFPVDSLSFYLLDPRIALVPVPPDWVAQLGGKVYRLSSDPFKFQDAVVVGTREGYYGECQFQIDLTAPQYLKMNRSTLKGLFGKFNPSTGDLVFSRTGELLGVMANNTYCINIRNFDTAATFRFGNDVSSQPIAQTLSSLYATVTGLPFKLQ